MLSEMFISTKLLSIPRKASKNADSTNLLSVHLHDSNIFLEAHYLIPTERFFEYVHSQVLIISCSLSKMFIPETLFNSHWKEARKMLIPDTLFHAY